METFQLWEGKEDKRTVRRLICAKAILDEPMVNGDAEANVRLFFKLYTEKLKHVADVQMSVEGGESSLCSLGLCWLQEDFSHKGDL